MTAYLVTSVTTRHVHLRIGRRSWVVCVTPWLSGWPLMVAGLTSAKQWAAPPARSPASSSVFVPTAARGLLSDVYYCGHLFNLNRMAWPLRGADGVFVHAYSFVVLLIQVHDMDGLALMGCTLCMLHCHSSVM